MSEIVKSEYNALDEQGNYKTHYFKTSADQVVGLGRMKNTEYQVGDVVYVDNNKKVALKCITTGTTSNAELDISDKAVGDTVADGSVVWQVCNRTSDVTSVNGKTGDVVVGEIVDASINGKVITLTFADGTTKTLTTQDTNTSNWSISKQTSGYTMDNTTGLKIAWGTFSAGTSEVQVTFPSPFTVACYGVVCHQSSKEENTNARSITTTGFKGYCHGGMPTSQGYIAIGV